MPELPILKLSRTLSGAAGAEAATPKHEIAAAMAMAVLPMSTLRSNLADHIFSARYVTDDYVAAARHGLVDALIERDRRGVDEAQ